MLPPVGASLTNLKVRSQTPTPERASLLYVPCGRPYIFQRLKMAAMLGGFPKVEFVLIENDRI